MAALLRADTRLWTPGQVKPTGVPRIDWSHPLAQGLLFYGFDTGLGVILDLAGGRPSQQMPSASIKASNSVTPWGSGLNWTPGSGTDGRFFSSDAAIRAATANPPWTAAMATVQKATNAQVERPFNRTAGNGSGATCNWLFQYPASSSQLSFYLNSGGTVAGPVGTFSGSLNSLVTAVGVATSGSTASFYANGALVGSLTGLTIGSSNTNDAICFSGDSSANSQHAGSGFVFYGAFWNRALSQAEILQLHLDPYCFLVPGEGEMPALPQTAVAPAVAGVSAACSTGAAVPAISGGVLGVSASAQTSPGAPVASITAGGCFVTATAGAFSVSTGSVGLPGRIDIVARDAGVDIVSGPEGAAGPEGLDPVGGPSFGWAGAILAGDPAQFATALSAGTFSASACGGGCDPAYLATAPSVFTLTRNGVAVGSVTFEPSQTTPVFTLADPTRSAGDVFGAIPPASPDATLRGPTFFLN